ncbi:4-hydroxy-3-methylbut-2-enyl diphosphate reductase [Methylopila turkensis]|uniref:4-hydroxy-3-methylbut-2-enyl diphosphate reductase n=1 Tax=Methylopila turkensis TaxID=1437816 RepID=A0A9W6N5I5_9HYPH|nr:4-hydroxy-3-methylbut-2-enyl diphosphate reductase [Methylopila turkensis]GLK78281.1 4-hydroxy-3-methylbut-2-enyl diphosphate reductase 1 [Methylopila turkensis]
MTPPRPLRIVLAKPRGFCAGVVRAIDIVERALSLHGAPVYVRREIVHNAHVVAELKNKGAIFVDEIDDLPEGAVTVFSAHGVARSVERAAAARRLDVIDAICPLVGRVHKEGARYAALGFDVVLIGHEGHPEVEGTKGRIDGRLHVVATAAEVMAIELDDPTRVAFVTQTTLSVSDTREVIEALKARFPAIVGPDTRDICYATQNRQAAVLDLAPHVDAILVVGAKNSSNSNRLREIGEGAGRPSYLIDTAAEIELAWLASADAVGLTAGASAPERLVNEAIARLSAWRPVTVEPREGIDERVAFRLPARLAGASASPREAAHV